jgi:TonB family protein
MQIRTLFLTLALLLAFSAVGLAQTPAAAPPDTAAAFDTPPQPVGGTAAPLYQVKYPEAARKDGIEGKVLVSVTVSADGHTAEAEILKGVRADLDQAARAAVLATRWEPAQKNHHPVSVKVVVPIQFKLDKTKK